MQFPSPHKTHFRFPQRALLATLLLSVVSVSTMASVLVPVADIGMRKSGSCGYLSYVDDGTYVLKVYVGQVIEFGISGPNAHTVVDNLHEWTFEGDVLPASANNTVLGSSLLRRHWNTPGNYRVTAHGFDASGNPVLPYAETLLVIVLPDALAQVRAHVTADNGYMLGFGTQTRMTSHFDGVWNTSSSEIVGPTGAEIYSASAKRHGYIYVAAWSDKAVSQGLLGTFVIRFGGIFNTHVVHSGDPRWEVYASGVNVGPAGPSKQLVNSQIRLANNANGLPHASSIGWVGQSSYNCSPGLGDIAIGGLNDGVSTSCGTSFGEVDAINPIARWMWYADWQQSGSSGCGIAPGFDHKEFLIFRFPLDRLPDPPKPFFPFGNWLDPSLVGFYKP